MAADLTSSANDGNDGADKADVVLELLNAVHDNSAVTQRSLARELGVALGIANATLRRCVEKGLIKVREAPARRYAYYLTPRGFAEKSRLTAEYLTDSLKFFRRARTQCEALLQDCAGRGWRRVILAGGGDLAEIARLCRAESGVELVALIEARQAGGTFADLPIVAELAEVASGDFDAVIVTDVRRPQATFDALRAAAMAMGMEPERILAPPLLRVSTRPPVEPAEGDAP